MMPSLKTFREKLSKEPMSFLIIILVLIAIAIIFVEPKLKKQVSFEIEDKCGKFVNLVSHTIQDEDACKTRCRSQCLSIEQKYKKAEFKENVAGCNSCKCFCR